MNTTSPTTKTTIEILHNLLYEAKTSRETVYLYDQWAENYEKYQQSYGYSSPSKMVEFLEKVMTDSSIELGKSSKVIDIAAGTGLVGEALRAKGFTGEIDAHDGSDRMLQIAKEKNGIYNRTFCHVLERDVDTPEELSSGYYDILLICGTLYRTDVIHQDCLKHFVKCIRPGGVMIYSTRNLVFQVELDFKIELEKVMFRLEQTETVKLIDVEYQKRYRENVADIKEEKNLGMYYYCYQRLQ